MLATTSFSSDYCNEINSLSILNIIWDNYVAGLPQDVHMVFFKIWLIWSNRHYLLKNRQVQVYLIITLCLGSIGTDRVISETVL